MFAQWVLLASALSSPIAIAADDRQDYDWRLPPGFPKPRVPADNPMSLAKVQLGCRLFFDKRLSINDTYACASCHQPKLAFSDGLQSPVGATGEPVRRNAMSLTNVAYNATFTWASMQTVTLESQMTTPLFGKHPLEMGLQNESGALIEKLADAGYAREFAAAFPGDRESYSITNLVKAIAAYERTLISGRSAFDRYVFDDAREALSAGARRGMSLFFSARTGCAECHAGLNFSGVFVSERTKGASIFANTGLYDTDGHGGYPTSDLGLVEETATTRDMGRFRVPTLRNIALTGPYMHDGSVTTLADVLDHYMLGGRANRSATNTDNSLKDIKINPLTLTAAERDDLIAFLDSLTDTDFVNAQQRDCNRIATH